MPWKIEPDRESWYIDYVRVLEQPPVFNVFSDILDLMNERARILFLKVRQSNDEVAAKNLEIRLVRPSDADYWNIVLAAANNTWYYIYMNGDQPYGVLTANSGLSSDTVIKNFGYTTGVMLWSNILRIRQATALGTSQELEYKVIYEQLRRAIP